MSFTSDQLSALRAAYAQGVLSATLPDGSQVRYRSLDEMERVISNIEGDLGQRATHTNVIYPTHKRGFDSAGS